MTLGKDVAREIKHIGNSGLLLYTYFSISNLLKFLNCILFCRDNLELEFIENAEDIDELLDEISTALLMDDLYLEYLIINNTYFMSLNKQILLYTGAMIARTQHYDVFEHNFFFDVHINREIG